MNVEAANSTLLETDGSTGGGVAEAPARPLWYAVVGVFVIVTSSLISRFQYSLYPDATSYLSLAEAYARGEFWNAVNGYWAPLYCWLLAPFLVAGVDRLLAPKLLSLVIGVATLAGLRRLFDRIGLPATMRNAGLIAVVPSLVYWSVSYVTPDFLLVCVLTWYFSVVLDRSASSSLRAGLLAGALGGAAYLAKQYAMPFIGAHLLLSGWLRWREERLTSRRAAVGQWLVAAYVVFFVISGPWIAAMSMKYGRLTISGAGSYNWYLHGPGARGQYNVGTQGLEAPPFPGAVSAWVDPTTFADHRAWNVATASAAVRHKLGQALSTAWLAVIAVEKFTLLGVPILLAAILLAVAFPTRVADLRRGYLALSVLLFFTGYVLIADEVLERLVWIGVILLIVLAASVFERAGVRGWPAPWRLVALAVMIGSFWVLPMRRIVQEIDDGKHLHDLALRVERDYGLGGRIGTVNRYADSLRLAFFTRASFYGRVSQRATLEEVLEDVRTHQIDNLLIWTDGESPGDGSIVQELARRFPERTRGQLNELRILDVRQLQERGPADHRPEDRRR